MEYSPATQTIALFSALLCSGLLLNCGGGSAAQAGGGGSPKLTQITIVPPNPTVTKGMTQQLTATATYDDGSKQNLGAAVTWQSNQSSVAAINIQGIVTAMGQGVAQVSATYQGVKGATSVTVSAPALVGVTVAPIQSSLPVGESEQLTATGTFSDGSTQDLTQSATWLSLGSSVASVSLSGDTTANAVGTVTISATSGSLSGSASLTVTPPAVLSLNVNPATLSIGLGSSRQFQAIATLSDGTTQDLTGVVAWSSTQPAIAGISSGGLAVAQEVGSTSIVAQDGGVSGSANLTVMPLVAVNYFDRASAVQAGTDSTIRLTNPGSAAESLCAMVYVFDQNQEMNECCGCSVSDSGLRTLSLTLDLTANPLTGKKPPNGVIKVVPSDIVQNPLCDPSTVSPTGVILGWGSNVQLAPGGTFQATETKFETAPLSDGESSSLAAQCNFVKQLGSGKGICSCGTGD
jgi:hypothetical protein